MKYFILILSIFLVLQTNAQSNSEKYLFINNNKIKYSIGNIACDTCVPIKSIGYRIFVSLNKKEQKIIKEIDKETWIYLLSNPKTDWAANLILYNLYNRDAFFLTKYNSRRLWLYILKKDDISFWKDTL